MAKELGMDELLRAMDGEGLGEVLGGLGKFCFFFGGGGGLGRLNGLEVDSWLAAVSRYEDFGGWKYLWLKKQKKTEGDVS